MRKGLTPTLLVLWLAAFASAHQLPFLEDIFRSSLSQDQLSSLNDQATPEKMAALMSPEQKETTRGKLAALEAKGLEPAMRIQIAKGYELLGFDADAYRAQAESPIPDKSHELTAAASVALARGDNEAAATLAAEALAMDPNNDKAFGVLKLTERRVPSAVIEAGAIPGPPQPAEALPPSPAALSLMRKVVAARQAGDMDGTFHLALDAMRADPTAPDVQDLYRLVIADRAKQLKRVRSVLGYMEQAGQASKQGLHEDAVTLAQKAAELDSNPALQRYLAEMRRRQAEAARKQEKPSPAPARRQGWPLLPLAAGGLGLAAYGVHRSRRPWADQEFARPEDEDPDSERLRNNSHHAKGIALAVGVFIAVRFGVPVLPAAGAAGAAVWRAIVASFQRVAVSQAGKVGPGGEPILIGAAKAGRQQIPGFTALESQIINEAQAIIKSPLIAELEAAHRVGRPAVVNIEGRIIQYEPNILSSGMTDFARNSFYIGRDAFKSSVEFRKTILQELYRLANSKSAAGVTGNLASHETDDAFAFANRAARTLSP